MVSAIGGFLCLKCERQGASRRFVALRNRRLSVQWIEQYLASAGRARAPLHLKGRVGKGRESFSTEPQNFYATGYSEIDARLFKDGSEKDSRPSLGGHSKPSDRPHICYRPDRLMGGLASHLSIRRFANRRTRPPQISWNKFVSNC